VEQGIAESQPMKYKEAPKNLFLIKSSEMKKSLL
jgi:hypothetical protein